VSPVLLESAYGLLFGECLAFALGELGELDRARSITPQEPMVVDSWAFLGVAAATVHNRLAIGDLTGAERVGAQLAPYAGRLATVGSGPAFGDVHLALGRLAHAHGDDTAALAHVDASVDLLGRGGLVPWHVRALLHRHELTGDPADLERAAEALATRELPHLERRLSERQAASK
jgi:hypothetical protein